LPLIRIIGTMYEFFLILTSGGIAVFFGSYVLLDLKVTTMTSWISQNDKELSDRIGKGGIEDSSRIQRYDLSTIENTTTRLNVKQFQETIEDYTKRGKVGLLVAVTFGFLAYFFQS